MNFTYENQGNNTFLVAEIPADAKIDTLALGMITNNAISGMAPAIYTQLDDKRYVKYNVSAKVPLNQFFSGTINRKRLFGVFNSIISAMISADDYMIEPSTIALKLDYIYADVSTCEAIVVCVPVLDYEQEISNVGVLFKNILFSSQFERTENCDYVAKLINYLNGSDFSVMEFKQLLQSLENDNGAVQQQPMASGVQVSAQSVTSPVQPQVSQVASSVQSQVSQVAPAVQPQVPSSAPQMAQPAPQVSQSMPQMQSQMAPQMSQGVPQMPQAAPQMQVPQMPQQQKGQKPAKKGKAAQPATPAVPAAQQDKKKFGLFGGKDKKKATEQPAGSLQIPNGQLPTPQAPQGAPQIKPHAQVTPQMAQPAPQVAPQMAQSMPQVAPQMAQSMPQVTPQMSQPAPQVTPQMSQPAPQVAPQMTQTRPQPTAPQQPRNNGANFGETTFLNAPTHGETTVLNAAPASAQGMPFLIRYKNNEKIVLNKPVFRIGKEKSYVDYFISDNSAISRSHANILNMDGKFYVIDTNSTNHTFLNGQMLQSNMETEIKHGDKIRLADEEFEFKTF